MEEHAAQKQGERTEAADACFTTSWLAVHEKLRRRARYLTRGDDAQAEDLLSCTALKALQLLRHSAARIHNPEGFFFLVLQHAYIDSVRREQRETRLFDHEAAEQIELLAAPQSLSESLSYKKTLEQLVRLLSRLPQTQQQLFALAFIEGASYVEIAASLDISNALVRKRIQLLRDKLHFMIQSPQTQTSQMPE
jgi:RNA polymerase sigma-70 factor (ECF subfamily)